MVRVYFTNGKEAAVSDATAAEFDVLYEVAPSGLPPTALVCKDAQGKVLAKFRESELVGYVIEPEGSGTLRAA